MKHQDKRTAKIRKINTLNHKNENSEKEPYYPNPKARGSDLEYGNFLEIRKKRLAFGFFAVVGIFAAIAIIAAILG